jgi:hypothetical protein
MSLGPGSRLGPYEIHAAIGRREYDVAGDDRILINTVVEDAAAPITLVENWKPPIN